MTGGWERWEDNEQSHPPVAREPSPALGNPLELWVALSGAQPETSKKETRILAPLNCTNHVYLNSSAVRLALPGKALENWIHQLFREKKNPRVREASSLPEGGGRRGWRGCLPSFPPRFFLSAPSRRPLGKHLTSGFWDPKGFMRGLSGRGVEWGGVSHFCGQGGKVVGTG